MNSGRPVTPLAAAVVTHLARLTGRRAHVLRDDLIGLVIEQSIDARVTQADLTLFGQVQQGLDEILRSPGPLFRCGVSRCSVVG